MSLQQQQLPSLGELISHRCNAPDLTSALIETELTQSILGSKGEKSSFTICELLGKERVDTLVSSQEEHGFGLVLTRETNDNPSLALATAKIFRFMLNVIPFG
jgi:hypothetical protein